MDIIIGTRGQPKEFNLPHRSQHESNDHNSSGQSWRSEKLADR
jgi:hypothetical protein